jgi:malonate transporter and related proteins
MYRLCKTTMGKLKLVVILQGMNTFELLFPDFSLILCGYLVCRHTALNRKVWEQVESLVYFFLFPVLLFHSIVKSPLDLGAASHLVAATVLLALAGIALSYALAALPGVNKSNHAACAQVAFRFNSFIALAIAERVSGREGLLLVALMIGVCVPLCNVGAVWPMAKHGKRGFVGELVRNPLILATTSGLAANLAGFHMPTWLEPSVTRIGAASLALGLMAAGAGMQMGQLSRAKRLGLGVLGIRHLVMPLMAFALCKLLQLSPLHSTVLLAFSALPTASSAYVLAARMGYNGALVAGLVTASTLLAMLSLPFALQVLRPLL